MKLFLSAIALLGTVQVGFADPEGRFDLQHGNPKMEITETTPNLKGKVYFSSPDDDRFSYAVEFYDLSGAGESPTTCLVGSSITPVGENASFGQSSVTGRLDQTSEFDLPASVWSNTNTAVICARIKSVFDNDEIDVIETLGTITRTFTGEFSLSVGVKTEDAEGFLDADNENTVEVEQFLCDDGNNDITDTSEEFARGQDFKICVRAKASGPAYNVDALKNVTCSYGTSPGPAVQIRNSNTGNCLYEDEGRLKTGYDCVAQQGDTLFAYFDEYGRIVDASTGKCLRYGNDDPSGSGIETLHFVTCPGDSNPNGQNVYSYFQTDNQQQIKTSGNQCIGIESSVTLLSCTKVSTYIVRMDYTGPELLTDALVDADGNAVGLAAVSDPGDVMSFTGVVKSKYFDNGNDELVCSGDVELSLVTPPSAGRRLEATKNVRFMHRASSAVQTRDLKEEVETEFSVGIKLDPGSSSAAAASNGMTSMGLMAAAVVVTILAMI